MRTIWKVLLLLLLNIIVSASVAYAMLYYWDNIRNKDKDYQLVTIDSLMTEMPEQTAAVSDHTEISAVTEVPAENVTAEITVPEDTPEPTPVIRGAKIEISIIRNPGSLESEALRIVSNSDEVITLDGWTLEDADGNLLKFPNIQLLRKGVFVEVYSRPGHTTPYEIYWNREAAVWQPGETAVIKDMFGQIQATYRVP